MDLQINESGFRKTISKTRRPVYIMVDGRWYMSTHCFRHPNISDQNLDDIKLKVVEREEQGKKIKRATCPKCYMFMEIQ